MIKGILKTLGLLVIIITFTLLGQQLGFEQGKLYNSMATLGLEPVCTAFEGNTTYINGTCIMYPQHDYCYRLGSIRKANVCFNHSITYSDQFVALMMAGKKLNTIEDGIR